MVYFIGSFAFIMLVSAFCASFIPVEYSLIMIGCSVLGSAGFFIFGRKYFKIAALFASAAIGFGIVSANLLLTIYPSLSLDGISAEITGTVTEVSSERGNPVFTVKTDSVNIEGSPQKITVLVSGWEENFAEPFDKISAKVNFQVYADSDFSEILLNRSKKISIHAYTDSPIEVIGEERFSLAYGIHFIREKISGIIYRFFSGWHSPFMEQILIGTKGELENEIITAFRKSGMSHILAISGMHMTVIVKLFQKLFKFFDSDKKHNRFKTIFIIVFIFLYMFIGGFGMSVRRCAFMLLSHYASRLFFSGSKSSDNLGIAVTAVLLTDPFAACDVGFLMSVSACAAISCFAPPMKEYLSDILKSEGKPVLEYFIYAFCVSSVAFLSVLPVSAVVFQKISLVSVFSNLFAGFFAQGAIIFGFITVIIGFFPFFAFFASAAAFIASICCAMLYKIAEFFAGFAFSYIDVSTPWILIWIFGSALIFLLPILFSKSLRFVKYSALISVFILSAGVFLNYIFFSDVAEIKISVLEHGTAISCSKEKDSVLIVNKADSKDSFDIDFPNSGYKTVISFNPVSDSAEFLIVDSANPEKAFLSSPDSLGRFDFSEKISETSFCFSKDSFIKILPDSAAAFEINGVRVLYIFSECDIMELEPKFRKADIIILDGVSPEDFPVLRCDYLILRQSGGYYSGTSEIIVLKTGEIKFFAFEGNLKKGCAAG